MKTTKQDKATKHWGGWFGFYDHNGVDRVHPESNRQLPAECIADCSSAGPVDEAVSYWVKRLDFNGPSWLFRSHLKEYGCWTSQQLADHEENRERVLWLWACACHESPGECDYLWLGV